MQAVATHCPYCALQCGMHLSGDPGSVTIHANARFPVNKGGLCVKGWSAGGTLAHPDRLLEPLVRGDGGVLAPASWDEALQAIARRITDVQTRHGRDAVGVLGSGSLTNEKAYLTGKFARVALGTANVDYNGRFCMSTAAAAAARAFGIDRGLPFPLEDLARASVVMLIGANPAETMPPVMQYFEAQQAAGGSLIVVDPRRTPTASWATRHLRLRPGSDAALANGLLHVLIRDGLIDERYVLERTEGFEEARGVAASCWPERVERLTGIPEAALVETAHMLGQAASAMVITARGPEQQAHGVTNALAYINLALALGLPGKAFSGYGTLTGQGNGQGGREHGQKADQLPGYRRLDDPAARRHVAQVWDVPEASLPKAGKSAFEMLEASGTEVQALIVMGFNVIVSSPDAFVIERRLRALDTLIVVDFFLSETARLADVVLPAAQWAEEEGTMTNLEGRVVSRLRARPPPEGVRTDLEILVSMARAVGKGRWFPSSDARVIFDELRCASKGGPADYSGISYERIAAEDGVFWPCPADDHPGTPRLFEHDFPTASGRARFHATPHGDLEDARNDEFPLYLTTGRLLAHYQSGNQTRRIADLQTMTPEPLVELHPSVARRVGVSTGELVTLTTRRGSASFKAKVTKAIREDTVFVPFHWGDEWSVNRLTSPALDPISRMPAFKACAVRVDAVPGADRVLVKPDAAKEKSG
jgi:assimilatory nitrate reductase catalytic subunit